MGDHLIVIEASPVLGKTSIEADLEDFLEEHPDVPDDFRLRGMHGGFRSPESVRPLQEGG